MSTRLTQASNLANFRKTMPAAATDDLKGYLPMVIHLVVLKPNYASHEE